MAKTRSQLIKKEQVKQTTRSLAIDITIKTEEFLDDPNLSKPLHCTGQTVRKSNRINKESTSKRKRVGVAVLISRPKYIDKVLQKTKSKANTYSTQSRKWQNLIHTHEQVKLLIHYIVTTKMGLVNAAEKLSMNVEHARVYYKQYKRDPEHKIPEPEKIDAEEGFYSETQLERMINYIVNDNLSVAAAAKKADVDIFSAVKCYENYFKSSDRKYKLSKEHAKFIDEMFEKNPKEKTSAIYRALKLQFPGVGVQSRTVSDRIRRKMPNIQVNSAVGRPCHNKMFDDHANAIANIYKVNKDLELSVVLSELLKVYPDLKGVNMSGICYYLRKNWEKIWNVIMTDSIHTKGVSDEYAKYFQNVYQQNPEKKKRELYDMVEKNFAGFNIPPIIFDFYLKATLGEWYKSNLNGPIQVHSKLTKKHTEFLFELYKKHPKKNITKATTELTKAFPKLSITSSALGRHLSIIGLLPKRNNTKSNV